MPAVAVLSRHWEDRTYLEVNVIANAGQINGSDTPVTDSEAGDFTFKHVLLVSGISPPDGPFEQGSIHHWQHNTSGTSFVIPTKLAPDDLRHISGFHELGTYSIPANQSSSQERHAYLSSLMSSGGLAVQQQGVGADKALIKNITEKLESAAPVSSSQEEATLKLYSFEIATRAEGELACGNADEMVWNWVKPASLYLTTGAWYRTMEEAVIDGVWRAGVGFSIHVEVVGTTRKERMFERGHGR